MSRFQNSRDNVLTPEERVKSARKCVSLLADIEPEDMNDRDRPFVLSQRDKAPNVGYQASEGVLQWLRDCVDRYVTS